MSYESVHTMECVKDTAQSANSTLTGLSDSFVLNNLHYSGLIIYI